MTTLNIALIGRGYSMATFLTYAPWDHYLKYTEKFKLTLKIDIYGEPGPWSDKIRGIGIVNHARYMWSRHLAGSHKSPSPRALLYDENANIIKNFRR